mgnify:CR=1 FL=1
MLSCGGPGMSEVACAVIERHGLDLYRHDTSGNQWSDWASTCPRHGFEECSLWRHYDAFYAAAERIRARHPGVILERAAAGGARSDLATAARRHESFQGDLTPVPLAYRMASGFSVYLPPEALQSAYHGMGEGAAPDTITALRCIYRLGNVPCIYWTRLLGRLEHLEPEELEEWCRYAGLYTSFIRPILSRSRVYHHAPVHAEGDRATCRQLIDNILACKAGDEGECGLGTAGLEKVFADFDAAIRLGEVDGERPFRHIKVWYNMLGYAAFDYNGCYASSREDVERHGRVALPGNAQAIGVDVYHYWFPRYSPFDPADLSVPRESVRAHADEWQRLRARYYPGGLKTCVCEKSSDPSTWIPGCWNDTHALLGAIELAGAKDAMMW